MKKILIVNSRSSDRKLTGMVMWGPWAVASHFKRANPGAEVILLDENNEDGFEAAFEEACRGSDLIGFSLSSMQIKYSAPLARRAREISPSARIIAGGIHPILFPDQDYGDYFDEVITEELPKDCFDHSLLPAKVREIFRSKRAQVVTGFNCSYKCAFCINSVRKKKYEGVPVERITADIAHVVEEFDPPKIYFRDEDFFQDIDKARAVIDFMDARKYRFIWDANSRVSHFRPGKIDDELLGKMVSSGCRQVRFGVESGSQKILNFLRKGQTPERTKFAVAQCVKHGIHATCSVMTGIPTETAGDREETYRLVEELAKHGRKVDILGPQIYRPYPGGKLFEAIRSYGYNLPDTFEGWVHFYDRNPLGDVFDTDSNYPWLSRKENRFLPYVWVVAHYGLNYRNSGNPLKRMIGLWMSLHWKLRWFGGLDVKAFMSLRKMFLKSDLE